MALRPNIRRVDLINFSSSSCRNRLPSDCLLETHPRRFFGLTLTKRVRLAVTTAPTSFVEQVTVSSHSVLGKSGVRCKRGRCDRVSGTANTSWRNAPVDERFFFDWPRHAPRDLVLEAARLISGIALFEHAC